MSDTKFTPGPWMAEAENVHTGCVATCHGDADTWFEVWSENWEGGIDQEANANLIAAAPDMYALLKDILENYECGDIVDQEIQEVLAKAEGK